MGRISAKLEEIWPESVAEIKLRAFDSFKRISTILAENKTTVYTVIIFLARNGRTRAVKFRPKNFGRISFDVGEISPNQQIFRLSNGRNSPKMGEFRPKFLRANLNCADSPISNKFRPKKITV
jgi:hypothetical protein